MNRNPPPVLFTETMTPLDDRDSSKNPALSDYLLVCQSRSTGLTEGCWQFDLESTDGTPVFSAEDNDVGDLNRLTLLAAVRGLESIDGPAAVTLVSSNRYLIRSLSDSLPRWRSGGFMWEHFGRRIDVQHADLWRRIDRAISIHRVQACLVSSRKISSGQENHLRVDSPHSGPKPPKDPLRRWLMGDVAAAAAHRVSETPVVDRTPRIVIRNRRSPNQSQEASPPAAVLQSA